MPAIRKTVTLALVGMALAAETMPTAQQNAMVQKHCAVCHTDAARNGGLTLQHFDAAHVDPSLAAMLASKLKGGAMGAAGLPKVDHAIVEALIAALTAESSGADQWTITQAPDSATQQPVLTASILRTLSASPSRRDPSLYRLVIACNATTQRGEMQLSWAPSSNDGALTASVDGHAPKIFRSDAKGKMGNGSPGTAEPASALLRDLAIPTQSLKISDLFPGETVTFPFAELPDSAHQALSKCFTGGQSTSK